MIASIDGMAKTISLTSITGEDRQLLALFMRCKIRVIEQTLLTGGDIRITIKQSDREKAKLQSSITNLAREEIIKAYSSGEKIISILDRFNLSVGLLYSLIGKRDKYSQRPRRRCPRK